MMHIQLVCVYSTSSFTRCACFCYIAHGIFCSLHLLTLQEMGCSLTHSLPPSLPSYCICIHFHMVKFSQKPTIQEDEYILISAHSIFTGTKFRGYGFNCECSENFFIVKINTYSVCCNRFGHCISKQRLHG